MFGLQKLFFEESAQGDWNSVYMLIVLAIAAIAVITLIKPMFRQSQTVVKNFANVKPSTGP